MDQKKVLNINNEIRPSGSGAFIKVDLEKIDLILDRVNELVVIRSQLQNELSDVLASSPKLAPILELFNRSIRDLQDRATGLRMTPLKSSFLKLERVAKDLCIKLQKNVDVELSGEDVEIDRQVVETLSDPLLHLVRNALDHGIENSAQRSASQKNVKAKLKILARVHGGKIEIVVEDDGAGISKEKVFGKAQSQGHVEANCSIQALSEQQIFDFLFLPGFSMKESVTDVSGRGFGLDVVRSNIMKVKGQIRVESKIGEGTKFLIQLPMRASVTDGLQVAIANYSAILPLDSIVNVVDVREAQFTQVQHINYVQWQGRMVPVHSLGQILANKGFRVQANADKILIVIDWMGNRLGLLADKILGQSQVVSKSVRISDGTNEDTVGTAILGDGRVALVLDPQDLWKTTQALDKKRAAA